MSGPSTVSYQTNEFGISYLCVNNKHATAKVCLHGGHVTQFSSKIDDRERLWVSPNSQLDASKPIRGGIPICWPWFGDFKLSPHFLASKHQNNHFPAHGFLRTQPWLVDSVNETEHETRLVLKPETTVGIGFNYKADVTLIVTVGHELTLDLITRNTDNETYGYTCALHSYFAVEDISQTTLNGLSGDYVDKTRDANLFKTPNNYRFKSETDRVHLSTVEEVVINSKSKTGVKSYGHDSLVVWNPWVEKSVSMQDMVDDGYKNMLCVETAITRSSGHILNPGESHSLKQVIS